MLTSVLLATSYSLFSPPTLPTTRRAVAAMCQTDPAAAAAVSLSPSAEEELSGTVMPTKQRILTQEEELDELYEMCELYDTRLLDLEAQLEAKALDMEMSIQKTR